ncbi:MAG: LuxR C-terminal-related transcriptional regulator [Terriglobales bacterium]
MAIAPSKSGFLLLDTSLNLIASNPEAVQILAYPSKPDRIKQLNVFLSDRVRTVLVDHPLSEGNGVKEYQSGRRRYVCRKFQIDCNGKYTPQPAIAMIIERTATPDLALEELCRQFELTPRERETVELLVQGLTTKEIANRLSISPNTVKAFVRIVMVKMSVSTRSGIVGRLTGTRASG